MEGSHRSKEAPGASVHMGHQVRTSGQRLDTWADTRGAGNPWEGSQQGTGDGSGGTEGSAGPSP